MKNSDHTQKTLVHELPNVLQEMEAAQQKTRKVLEDQETPSSTEAMRRKGQKYINLVKTSRIPPRYLNAELTGNCEMYKSISEKRSVYQMALDFAKNGVIIDRGANRYSLFVCGLYGVGKTWLGTAVLKALAWETIEKLNIKHPPVWIKFHSMIREVQACYNPGSKIDTLSIIRKYQKAPILMVDDVGDMEAQGETEDRRRILYEIIDYRNDYMLPTIMTSNLDPDTMEAHYGERSMQRVIELCAFAEMGGVNLREKQAA